MAWQVSKRVWDSIKTKDDKKKGIDSSERLMLLALADKADEQGICWPKHDTSYQTLGDMVGVNRRSAMRLVESLAEMGHLWKSETVGRGHSNIFIVTIGLTEDEIKSRLALKGVTDDTIYNEEKVLQEAPINEPEKEMVLPVTQNGVTDDTNKGLNGVTGNTQSIMSPSLPSLITKGVGGSQKSEGKKAKELPPPISVKVYQEVANRYPDKATWQTIAETVGESQEALTFWKEIVTTWIGCGYNKINITGQLDCFRRKEIPSTRKGGSPDKSNQSTNPRASPKSITDIDQDRLKKLQEGLL